MIAFSFASAPPFVKKDIFRSPGVTSAISRASSERFSCAIGGPIVRQLVGLLLDRGDDLRVLVPDRDVDELRGEVEVAVPVVVPEPAALGARDRQRVDLVLHRPGVEDVLLVELPDPLPELAILAHDGHRDEA